MNAAYDVFPNELDPLHASHTLCLDGALLYPRSANAGEMGSTEPMFGIVGRPNAVVYADAPGGLNYAGLFRVHEEDGTISTYGDHVRTGEDGSPVTRRWAISRKEDRSGNEIDYNYDSLSISSATGPTDANHRLSSVDYVGGRVEFQYSDDPTGDGKVDHDHRVRFWNGSRTEENLYLNRVTVSGASGGVARSYEIGYVRSAYSDDLLVDGVAVCDREGVCMPATRFDYSSDEDVANTDFGTTNSGSLLVSEEDRQSLVTGDFNGDGLPDLAWLSKIPFDYFGPGDQEIGTQTLNASLQIVYSEGQSRYSLPHRLYFEAENYSLAVADTDGNGVAEPVLLGGGQQQAGYVDFATFEALRVRAEDPSDLRLETIARTGFAPQGLGDCEPEDANGYQNACHYTQVFDTVFVDVDGDSRDELLGCVRLTGQGYSESATSDENAYWRVLDGVSVGALPSGQPAEQLPVFGSEGPSAYGACAQECNQQTCETRSSFIILDANGDGRRDLLQVEGHLPPDSSEYDDSSPFVAGDNRYAVYGYGFPRNGYVPDDPKLGLHADFFQRYNQRNRYSSEEIQQPAGVYGPSADLLGDFNGDGLTDIARFQPYSGDEPADTPLPSDWGPEFSEACSDGGPLPPFTGRISFYLSRGNGQFVLSGSSSPFSNWADYCDRFQNAVTADVDGDRIAEVVLPRADGSLEVGNVDAGSKSVTWAPLGGGIDLFDRSAKRLFPIDITGVGQAKYIVADGTGLDDGETTLRASGLKTPVDMLVGVTDGYGARVRATYGALYDNETFEALPCLPAHESLAPARPLVSRIEIPFESGEARFVNHRYRGACQDAPDYYFGSFEQHETTSGVRPLEQGTDIATSKTTTFRDDYSRIFTRELVRGFVTRRVTDTWNPGDETFERRETVNTWDYIEDFFEREGVADQVPLWNKVAVGALVTPTSTTTRTQLDGECTTEMSCEPTSDGTVLSSSASAQEDFDVYGRAKRVRERAGGQCAQHELQFKYIDELVQLERRQARGGVTVGAEHSIGSEYECDLEGSATNSTVSFEYDDNTLLLTKEIRQEGVADEHLEIVYGYDEGRLVLTTRSTPSAAGAAGTTANSRSWNVWYDATGVFPEVVGNPLGHTETTWWHADLGLKLGVSDTNGVVARRKYDGFGRAVATKTQLGYEGQVAAPPSAVRYERVVAAGAAEGHPSPLRTVAVSPEGSESMVEYDRDSREIRTAWDVDEGLRVFSEVQRLWSNDGLTLRSSFPVEVGGASGSWNIQEYDILGRLVQSTPAASEIGVGATSFFYDGNLSVRRAADEGVWQERTDQAGQLIETVDPEGTRTCFYYGSFGHLEDVVVNPETGTCDGSLPDSDSVRTTRTHYDYDGSGRVVARNLPGRSQESITYNAFGDPWRLEDASGSTVATFDELGRVVERTDGVSGASTFEWDSHADCVWADGLLHRTTSGDGAVREFSYDKFGRERSSQLAVDDVLIRKELKYDNFGRMAELRHAGGPVVTYGFDSVGMASSIAANGQSIWQATERDVSGRLSAATFGNGVQVESVITAGILESSVTLAPNMTAPYPGAAVSMSEIDSLEVGHDAMGRPSYRDIPHLDLREKFDHDRLGRIVSSQATRGGKTAVSEDYEYWETGAIRSRSLIGEYSYGDEARPLSVTKAGGVEYSYDDDGRQLTRDEFVFAWRRGGRLASATDGNVTIDYAYDAGERRVRKTRLGPSGLQTTYYDGDVEHERSGSGALASTYHVVGGGGAVAALKRSASGYGYDVFYVHSNEYGSATVVTDEAGDVVERKDYDAFGRERSVLWAGSIDGGDSELDLGFTGHRREEEYGLIDMGGRHYDPHLGRFASPDPIVAAPTFSQGYDPFSYVLNDPLTFTDPSGFSPEQADPPDLGEWGWYESGEFYWHQDVTTGGSGTEDDPWVIPPSDVDGGPEQNSPSPDAEREESGGDAQLGGGATAGGGRAAAMGAGWMDWFLADGLEASLGIMSGYQYQLWLRPEGGLGSWVRGQLNLGLGPNGQHGVYNETKTRLHLSAFVISMMGGGGGMALAGMTKSAAPVSAGKAGLPNTATVARGGANITPESIVKGTGAHPSGVRGFSAECAGGNCLRELGNWIRHNKMGTTTVREIRAAGGEVVKTSGRSPNHVTVTGLDPSDASRLLTPSVPNPVPKAERAIFR